MQSSSGRPVWRPSGRRGPATTRPASAPSSRALEKTNVRSMAFDEWVHKKDEFDKGLDLLRKIDPGRWEKRDSHAKLTAALIAIDEALGVNAEAEVRKTTSGGAAKCMYDVWKRNTMNNHALTSVPLSKASEATLSETVTQYVTTEEVTVDDRSVERRVLPQVTYMFPAVPKKKGDQVKPLTADAKASNAIFLRELRRRWLSQRDEVVASAGKLSMALLESFLAKDRSGSSSQRPSAADLKRRALHILGIGKLSKWAEADLDEQEQDAKSKMDSKRHEAAHAHEGFVRKKKALELWLPEEKESGPGEKPQRFVFATGGRGDPAVPLRSKQTKIPSSTVDMMRSSGLRVVHALRAGRQGMEADLEKSRGQLEREGHVTKRNYADPSDFEAAKAKAQFGSTLEVGERVRFKAPGGKSRSWATASVERRTSSKFELANDEGEARVVSGADLRKGAGGSGEGRVEAGEMVTFEGTQWTVAKDRSTYLLSWVPEGGSEDREAEAERDELRLLSDAQQRQAHADESYREWLEVKRARELARDHLRHIECPDELKTEAGVLADEPTALAHWKAVGKHLKVVDRCLLDEWFEWSKGFEVTSYVCQVLWDAFEPIGDDVHTSYYSLARTTLAKVLRPRLNYREAAYKVVRRKWLRAAGGDGGDFSSAPAEEVAAAKQLGRAELKMVLRELGIELLEDQLRLVVDCFDDESRGTMDVDRFLEFTGPNGPRDKADALQRLRRRTPPVWESTCPITGLANAFRVTTAPASAQDSHGDSRVKVLSLSNGEKRRQVELKERARRVAILKHFDELAGSGGGGGGGGGSDDDGYSDDESEDDEYGDEDDGDGGASGGKKKGKCTMAQWMENKGSRMKRERKASMRALMELSRVRRDEAELQGLLEKGAPPPAPVFYAAGPADPEVVRLRDPLEENLLLCWEAAPKSLVAFFSVEMSGARGSKDQRENVFREICRDPDCARDSFRYMTWIRGLLPGTTYSFRIRAFNGFGPGPYTWETFTTRPRRPPRPLVLARTPTSVTLRWVEDESGARLVADLEAALDPHFPGLVFDGATVSLAELVAAVQRCASPGDLEFLGRTTTDVGLGGVGLGGAVSLLDALDLSAIEHATGAEVSWADVKSFLLRQAAGSKGKGSGGAGGAVAVRYHVEKCVSVTAGQWVKVMTTKFSHVTVPALESGVAYRFRVVAANANGLESKKSPSVVAITLLETPPPPRLAPCRTPPDSKGGVAIKLVWDPAAVFGMGLSQREQRKKDIDKILSSWTREGADDEGAVSLVDTFRRQDTYRCDAEADAQQAEVLSVGDLANLLGDLGLEPSEARKAEVLERALSADGETLSLPAVKAWWESDAVAYEVRRDGGVDGGAALEFDGTIPGGSGRGSSSSSSGGRRRSGTSVLCYRGSSDDGRSCLVAGLEPNTQYNLTLRVVTPKSCSLPSRPLVAHTPPATMERPVVIDSDSPRAVALKWYPSRNGAHKYVVECRLVEALDWERDRAVEAAQAKLKKQGWRVIFEGKDTSARISIAGGAAASSGEGVLPNSVYHFRVTGINSSGGCGLPSDHTLCRTAGRAGQNPLLGLSSRLLKPTNAQSHFTVECRGDVVVGDTIICTEQLLVGRDGKLAKHGSGATTVRSATRFAKSGMGTTAMRAATEGKVFVGERTIAAVVLKDSFRSAAHSRELGVTPQESRQLRLEVVWSTVSADSAVAFTLPRGEVIERDESALSEYEVFRMEWTEEARRLPEARERLLCRRGV